MTIPCHPCVLPHDVSPMIWDMLLQTYTNHIYKRYWDEPEIHRKKLMLARIGIVLNDYYIMGQY